MTNLVRPVESHDDSVRLQLTVALSQAAAFERFRHDVFQWWPRADTWCGNCLEDLHFEGRKGGALWERGPEGLRLDMARVLRWVAPERMILRWHVGPGGVPEPDPAKASEVEIRFSKADGGTLIELEHRGLERKGEGEAEQRAVMAVRWLQILQAFSDFLAPEVERAAARRPLMDLSLDPVLKDLPALV
jgi:hypothetical protein